MNNCKTETAIEKKTKKLRKMTKGFKILQKKLQKFKAELIYVFSLPGEKIPDHQLLCEEIERRFLFMKNLLSAEINASSPSKPHHLHHIGQRLTELETAFREWDDDRRTAAAVNNFDETASICSCNDSCGNDDGEACNDLPDLGSSVYEVQESLSFPEGLVDVKVEQEMGKKAEEDNNVIVKQEKRKDYCGALISGILMGVIMLRFSGCFHLSMHEAFLPPT